MEIVLAEVSALSLAPVVLAAAVAAALARSVTGDSPAFEAPMELSLGALDLALCLALGIACGLVGVVLTRGIRLTHGLGERLRLGRLGTPAAFGLGVGLVGLLEPRALGWLISMELLRVSPKIKKRLQAFLRSTLIYLSNSVAGFEILRRLKHTWNLVCHG